MILNPALPPEWNSSHAAVLKELLESQTGKRLAELAAYNCPSLLDGSDVNKTLVASGVRSGYEMALSFLWSLTVVQPEQPRAIISETYPSLDDDTKWDGATPKT
jgi:hypothetical protein